MRGCVCWSLFEHPTLGFPPLPSTLSVVLFLRLSLGCVPRDRDARADGAFGSPVKEWQCVAARARRSTSTQRWVIHRDHRRASSDACDVAGAKRPKITPRSSVRARYWALIFCQIHQRQCCWTCFIFLLRDASTCRPPLYTLHNPTTHTNPPRHRSTCYAWLRWWPLNSSARVNGVRLHTD